MDQNFNTAEQNLKAIKEVFQDDEEILSIIENISMDGNIKYIMVFDLQPYNNADLYTKKISMIGTLIMVVKCSNVLTHKEKDEVSKILTDKINFYLKEVVKNGVNVNNIELIDTCDSVIHAANSECYKTFLECGGDINYLSECRNTPLMWHIANTNIRAINELFRLEKEMGKEIDYNHQCSVKGNTALSLLVTKGNRHYFEMDNEKYYNLVNVIASRTNPKLADLNGNTALHFACLKRDAELIKILIQNGADINQKNEFELTPRDFYNGKIGNIVDYMPVSDKHMEYYATTKNGIFQLDISVNDEYPSNKSTLNKLNTQVKDFINTESNERKTWVYDKICKYLYGGRNYRIPLYPEMTYLQNVNTMLILQCSIGLNFSEVNVNLIDNCKLTDYDKGKIVTPEQYNSLSDDKWIDTFIAEKEGNQVNQELQLSRKNSQEIQLQNQEVAQQKDEMAQIKIFNKMPFTKIQQQQIGHLGNSNVSGLKKHDLFSSQVKEELLMYQQKELSKRQQSSNYTPPK